MNFGSGMPMPFARTDGRIIKVWQQPTHLTDDFSFSPSANYSMRLNPARFEIIAQRIFEDSCRLFHVPYGVCIHPGNYVSYSGEQGRFLMKCARQHGIPIWSIDQWNNFWSARDGWRITDYVHDAGTATFYCRGEKPAEPLSLCSLRSPTPSAYGLPVRHSTGSLTGVKLNGRTISWRNHRRFFRQMAYIPLPGGIVEAKVEAEYV